jgi:hypothetical protein
MFLSKQPLRLLSPPLGWIVHGQRAAGRVPSWEQLHEMYGCSVDVDLSCCHWHVMIGGGF